MKCDEVQQLHGPYLDSELDAKTTVEIQQHVATCSACARVVGAEASLDGRIRAGLNQGQRTAALWARIEQRVVAAAQSAAPSRPSAREVYPTRWWRELLWPCPQAWVALAAVWAVMLAVNITVAGDAPAVQARHAEPPSRELREMLRQQRQMLAELGGAAENLEGRHARPVTPQPRSQRHEEFQNI